MHSMRSDNTSRLGVMRMKQSYGLILAVLALSLYVVGGLLIFFVPGFKDMFGIGIFLSIFGVMIMRIMRNRGVS